MGAPPARARAARGRPLWRSSLKAAASALAHVACLCEPVCARDGPLGVQVDAVAPRRTSRSDGRSPQAPVPPAMLAGEWAGEWSFSTFRGRSLNEDLLMRRFVLAEEATRRRVQMEVAAKRYGRWWLPPGPSRLSEMSLADDDVAEDEAAESGSSSP
ncbi:uncharacterized protein LOC133917984 [Phragmites australis]|uniref:uncharacterized protein LOC133917984 n=1 Tax=Phragmites australis TaxID=29695 RepID=UPI002D79841D|nr:uncharacterized protein LOC133917984 [Phragmites australis]